MHNQLLFKLEEKVSHALEMIELLRIQLAEAEESNHVLKIKNDELQNRQIQWEQSLTNLLKKLSNAELPLKHSRHFAKIGNPIQKLGNKEKRQSIEEVEHLESCENFEEFQQVEELDEAIL